MNILRISILSITVLSAMYFSYLLGKNSMSGTYFEANRLLFMYWSNESNLLVSEKYRSIFPYDKYPKICIFENNDTSLKAAFFLENIDFNNEVMGKIVDVYPEENLFRIVILNISGGFEVWNFEERLYSVQFKTRYQDSKYGCIENTNIYFEKIYEDGIEKISIESR